MNIIFILKNYDPFISMRQLENKQKTNFGTIYPMLYKT